MSRSSLVSLPHFCCALPELLPVAFDAIPVHAIFLPSGWTLRLRRRSVACLCNAAVPIGFPPGHEAKKYGRSRPRRRLRPETGLARGEGDGGRSQSKRADRRSGSLVASAKPPV